ncbi:DUF1292 domain-containing protein [Fervidibacillus halotolerans]|uniref:DUF1292 domain-containing protein n=1 Tax=Fervidibacillus halotolerans TaxID=2980027 RepID=A0A9E8M0V6_9BACI|nr:DUF1292 domain-containing protein [Fervidibacillus halotolerans]WAA13116.1 DUF1292 domain-containing protein [Fervidibacillus halotolerans]
MEEIEIGEVFTITDENDEEQEVEVIAKATIDGTVYVAVSFVEDLDDEDSDEDIDVFFLKMDEEGDLEELDTEEEYEKVFQVFDEMFEDVE